jgi:hypothetical protein
MIVTFIGNCQTLAICFYLQQLSVNDDIGWVMYSEDFLPNVTQWSEKIKNKILNIDDAIERVKISDFIIYQEINIEKSIFSNFNYLQSVKQERCRLISMSSIYIDFADWHASLREMKKREDSNNVLIRVSDLIEAFPDEPTMISVVHPSTFLFMKILKEICLLINIPFFSDDASAIFLEYNNYIGLPD